MIAFKFLARGAVGPFSGFRWPTPAGGAPGDWVAAAGELPARGVHACRPADLPYWIDEELWIAELEGDVQTIPHQVVGSRGRLFERVDAWRDIAHAFGVDCAATLRVRVEAALAVGGVTPELAEQLRAYAADVDACAAGGDAAVAAYVAARASALLDGPRAGSAAERRRQAAWLEQRLPISGGFPR